MYPYSSNWSNGSPSVSEMCATNGRCCARPSAGSLPLSLVAGRKSLYPSFFGGLSTGSYSYPWLVYHSMVRTSKPLLWDVTECNAYPLLLVGGELEVQASKNIVVISNWVKLSANARIGSLIGRLEARWTCFCPGRCRILRLKLLTRRKWNS
jgi:hypothetical protein